MYKFWYINEFVLSYTYQQENIERLDHTTSQISNIIHSKNKNK